MTNLRQGRWPQLCLLPRGTVWFTAAAALGLELGLGLLLPGTARALAPSHTRRPLPTALHATSVADTGSRGKHGKPAAQGHASTHVGGSHAAGSHTASSHAAGSRAGGPGSSARTHEATGKHGKGRKRQEEASDPVIPMFHAGRGHAPLEHGRGRGTHPQTAADRHTDRTSGFGRKAHAIAAPTFTTHASSRRNSAQEIRLARNTVPAAPLSVSHHGLYSAPLPAPAPIVRTPPPAGKQEVYAQGVAHPEDDERLPRVRNAPEDDGETAETGGAPVPIARIAPAPASTVPAPRTPLVQGFGSELAVPPSAAPGTDRPGGTRRRSHPSSWQPEALAPQPEPLEEREALLDAAVSPAVLPEVYDRGGHQVMPAPLRGSRDVLVHQNLMAMSDGLQKIYDDADLDRQRAAHRLVGFPVNESLRMNEDLPWNRRVARPWTVAFTADLARAFYERFHQPLQVNSAVRTVRYQAHLQLVNGNAAAIYGEAASPHLTGQAVDLAKRGMSQAELAWMRDTLLPIMRSGKIDVEEEFQQACFHISVYRSYAANRHTVHEMAQVRNVSGTAGTGVDDSNLPDR